MSAKLLCPVCGGVARWEPFISFDGIPRTGVFPLLPPASTDRHTLSFEYCSLCGLIRQQTCRMDVDPDYAEVDRSTAGQLPEYLTSLEEELAALCPDKKTLLVDVGGNDGSFLLRFCRNGYKKHLNVEPSRALAHKSAESGCRSRCAALTSEVAEKIADEYGKAGVVFLRHVLEHVADPLSMLRSIYQLLDENGIFYLEFPDCCAILEDGKAHELWEEHLYYYSPATIAMLLQKTGFTSSAQATFPHRGGYNTLIRARKIRPEDQPSPALPDMPENLSTFRQRWGAYCSVLHQASLSWQRPLYMLGASHPQTNFIHFSGIGHMISCAIDDDQRKIGRFLNMTPPAPIISTNRFKEIAANGTLLLTAWGCEGWENMVKSVAGIRNIQTIIPYALFDLQERGKP